MGSIFGLFVVLVGCFFVWIIFRPYEEGTLQERRTNPELNTNNLELHNERLSGFGKSKYRNDIYYVGPRGGVYYYSSYGRKTYV